MAGNPARSKMHALVTSQALGNTKIRGPEWSFLRTSALDMRRIIAMLPLALALLFGSVLSAQPQPFSVGTMLKIAGISVPLISPDGKTVVFTVQTVDLEKN